MQPNSIYKSRSQRIIFHLIAILLVFIYRIIVDKLLIESNANENIYFAIIIQFIRVIGLFYLWNTAIYFYKRQKYVLAFIFFIIATPFDWVLSLFIIKCSMYIIGVNPYLNSYWNVYCSLFPYSPSYLLLFLSDAFWGALPFILVKIVIEIYENAQTKKQLQERSNALEFEKAQSNIPSEWLKKSLENIHYNLKNNPAAQKAVEQLSQLLNFAFVKSREKNVLLTDEIQFLHNFLEFERMRHNPEKVSIQFDYNLDTNKETSVAPLIFINFIENAFKHGVNSTTNQSWVKVSLIQQENEIHFNVKNSLPNKNMEQTKIKDVGGVGLENVKKRLDLEYLNNYTLNFTTENIFEADLKIKLA